MLVVTGKGKLGGVGGSYSAIGKANIVSKLLQSNTDYLLYLPQKQTCFQVR